MASLQTLSTTFLCTALTMNPDALSFPWNVGMATDPTRTQILNELTNRAEIDNVVYTPPASKVTPPLAQVPSIKGKSKVK